MLRLRLKEIDDHLRIALHESLHEVEILRTEMNAVVEKLDVLLANAALDRQGHSLRLIVYNERDDD